MSWLDVLGWAGSALLVCSVMQARVLRFRILNTIACVILVVFNGLLAIWPMVALNVVLVGINVWFIVRLLRDSRDERAYAVLEVPPDDPYLRHFLSVESKDVHRFFPAFQPCPAEPGRTAYLVLKGHETVGAVLLHDAGDGVAQVDLDYVTKRYRDFTPGEFVHRRSGLFRERGYRLVRTPPRMVGAYYGRLGFERVGDHWEVAVPQA